MTSLCKTTVIQATIQTPRYAKRHSPARPKRPPTFPKQSLPTRTSPNRRNSLRLLIRTGLLRRSTTAGLRLQFLAHSLPARPVLLQIADSHSRNDDKDARTELLLRRELLLVLLPL